MRDNTPLAIVGYAYRAPGVGRRGLWEFLAEARSAWSPVPADRFDQSAYYFSRAEKSGTLASKGAHFLSEDVYAFDAPFFRLTPEEARAIDPQHRLVLECAVEAAESAGISLASLVGSRTGVFSSIGSLDYAQHASDDIPGSSKYALMGYDPCMFANRLSYFFDLEGPSLSVSTACAGSAYAIHLACQSLRAGECKAAFVGAGHLILGPETWNGLDTMGTLSPEGKSFSYDSKASGFGRGEGASCLIIKRLSDAIESGDPIQAVIRNSAVNHAGRTGTISTPSQPAQERLLLQVHAEVGLDVHATPRVEGHGTGTSVGDPIEAGAIAKVIGARRSPQNPLYLGSVKSNFGHLESASGIFGVLKAVMEVQRGLILPNACFTEMNAKIEGREKLKVPIKVTPWPSDAPRRVCVSSFGFGGSNAAIVLENVEETLQKAQKIVNVNGNANLTKHLTNGHVPPPNGHLSEKSDAINGNSSTLSIPKAKKTEKNGAPNTVSESPLFNGSSAIKSSLPNGNSSEVFDKDVIQHTSRQRLFVFSAKSNPSLQSYLLSFVEYLAHESTSTQFADDLSYTLGQRRMHFPRRLAVAADSITSLYSQLSSSATLKPDLAKDTTISFVFTGQGAQYAQMASGLEAFETFANTMNDVEEVLRGLDAPWELRDELKKIASESQVNDAEISQPACTAVQIALVVLLRSWGVTPSVVAGHSSGEIAAAFAAGYLSLETAVAIAFFRGQAAALLLEEDDVKGAMLAVGTSAEEAERLLPQNAEHYATVAAINSPQSVTISGDLPAIEEVQKAAEARGMFVRRLKVGVAYHSRHMERIASFYLSSIKQYFTQDSCLGTPQTSKAFFVSSVTGKVESAKSLNASYWVRNLLAPVNLLGAVEKIFDKSSRETTEGANQPIPNVLVEIGPHSALKGPILQTVEWLRSEKSMSIPQVSYLPSLVRGTESQQSMMKLAGGLFTTGCELDLGEVNQSPKGSVRVVDNLPAYEWNKSTKYEHKSRITAQKLHPGNPYNPVLGWRSPYSEGSECSFRQVITLEDMPWLRDHRLDDEAIFPFTGYLALAIEGLRAICPNTPASIVAKEIHIKRTLKVEEDEKVDVITKLRPTDTGTEVSSPSIWTFEVLSWSRSRQWQTHCYGQIEASSGEVSTKSPLTSSAMDMVTNRGFKDVDVESHYDEIHQSNIFFGPSFRRMTKLGVSPGAALHETELRELEPTAPSFYGSPITIDAPTLDSFLHCVGSIWADSDVRHSGLPTYLRRLRISNSIPSQQNQRFTIATIGGNTDVKTGNWSASAVVFAQDGDSLVPIAEFEYLRLRIIATYNNVLDDPSPPKSFQWSLEPHLDFMDRATLEKLLAVEPYTEKDIQIRHKINLAAVICVDRALKELTQEDIAQLQPHHKRFMHWADRTLATYNGNGQLGKLSLEEKSSLLQEVSALNGQGALLCAVGEQIVPILRGQAQPLEIMLADGRLSRNYEEDTSARRGASIMANYARHLSKATPGLRVLEIGGGTASATTAILEAMSRDDGESPAFANYTFTDISSGFFENASAKLTKWSDRITYQKLDISQDPENQGFEPGSFDLVVAANCLHATPDLSETMRNVRKLIRPGGRLLLLEVQVSQPCEVGVTLLPGWWLAQDSYRGDSGPMLTAEVWSCLLKETGFSGLDAVMPDWPGSSEHQMNVLCSTRTIEADEDKRQQITIYTHPDKSSEAFINSTADSIETHVGRSPATKPLLNSDPSVDGLCLFIDNPNRSILSDLDSGSFDALKKLFLETSGMLWVLPASSHPEACTIKGFLRTLRLEDTSKNLLLLSEVPLAEKGSQAVARIMKHLCKIAGEPVGAADQEFVFQDGDIFLPRLRPLATADDSFALEAGQPVRRKQNFKEHPECLKLSVDAVGSLDSVYFEKARGLQDDLGGDEIIIENEMVGVNFRDLLILLGSVPWGDTGPGSEGVGLVRQLGSSVKDLSVGDRVFYFAPKSGAIASHVRLPGSSARRIPAGLSAIEAAVMPVAYITALTCVNHVTRLQKGETILIHAASGGTGQACIRLAQHIGAEIFVTAGSQEKRDSLRRNFNIPETHIFSSRTTEFRDGILMATGGKGVDVVVNSVSDNLLQETWDLVADFGRWCEIGKKDFFQNSYLTMRPFLRNISFTGVDIPAYYTRWPQWGSDRLSEIVDLYERGVVCPVQDVHSAPISQIEPSLRKVQTGQANGKLVLTFGREETVLAVPPRLDDPSRPFLRADATYLISGGTGGIGRSLAAWLIENGARNVVLLGRGGSSNPEVAKLLRQYESSDACLRAVACNIGDRDNLAHALSTIGNLPPVRGVIHGALFLRDALLVNSNVDDWKNITGPRIKGAWNLHELCPNLDFFVSLGSAVSTIGNVGQAIYGGTGTFLDAFAQFRVARGLPAVTISVPVVQGVGYVAERGMNDQLANSLGLLCTESQLKMIIRGAIIGPKSGLNHDGKALTAKTIPTDDSAPRPWEHFGHAAALRPKQAAAGSQHDSSSAGQSQTLIFGSPNPLVALVNALMDKVALMTMIDIEEITPDQPLGRYGLDSLVSVELRNWIKREAGVELSLTRILQSANLQELAERILVQRDGQEPR